MIENRLPECLVDPEQTDLQEEVTQITIFLSKPLLSHTFSPSSPLHPHSSTMQSTSPTFHETTSTLHSHSHSMTFSRNTKESTFTYRSWSTSSNNTSLSSHHRTPPLLPLPFLSTHPLSLPPFTHTGLSLTVKWAADPTRRTASQSWSTPLPSTLSPLPHPPLSLPLLSSLVFIVCATATGARLPSTTRLRSFRLFSFVE